MEYVGVADPPLAVSVAEFKSAAHILEADIVDDGAFSIYLAAAQDAVEIATGCPLGVGSYAFDVPLWPIFRRWWFPCRPVTGITAATVTDEEGTEHDVLAGLRLLAGSSEPALVLPEGWAGYDIRGDNHLRIEASCGTAIAPPRLKQAIILLAREWFEAGVTTEEAVTAPRLSMGALRLIRQSRYRRPKEWG